MPTFFLVEHEQNSYLFFYTRAFKRMPIFQPRCSLKKKKKDAKDDKILEESDLPSPAKWKKPGSRNQHMEERHTQIFLE